MKLGIRIDNDAADVVDEIVLKVRKSIREGKRPAPGPGRPIGPGSIAAEIVERVIREHPELLKEFFEDDGASFPVTSETRETYQALPKARSRRQAQK